MEGNAAQGLRTPAGVKTLSLNNAWLLRFQGGARGRGGSLAWLNACAKNVVNADVFAG